MEWYRLWDIKNLRHFWFWRQMRNWKLNILSAVYIVLRYFIYKSWYLFTNYIFKGPSNLDFVTITIKKNRRLKERYLALLLFNWILYFSFIFSSEKETRARTCRKVIWRVIFPIYFQPLSIRSTISQQLFKEILYIIFLVKRTFIYSDIHFCWIFSSFHLKDFQFLLCK